MAGQLVVGHCGVFSFCFLLSVWLRTLAGFLVDLREIRMDFLGLDRLFKSFGLGLLVEFWSGLSWLGEEGGVERDVRGC